MPSPFPPTVQLSLQDPHHDFPGPFVNLSSFNLPEDLSRPRELDWHFLHKPNFTLCISIPWVFSV